MVILYFFLTYYYRGDILSKKMTHEEFLIKLNSLYNNEYSPIDKYETSLKKIKIKHNICNNIYEVTPNHILSGRKCPYCSKTNNSIYKNTEWFKSKIFELTNDEYTLLSEYKKSKEKVKFKHNNCNNFFEMRPEDFLRGQRCPECAKELRRKNSLKMTTDEFKEKIKVETNDEYSVLSEYLGQHKYIKMKHNLCNYEYNVFPINFLKGNRCPNCFGSTKKTTEEFRDDVRKLDPNYDVIGEYSGANNDVKMKHLECGYEYFVRPINFRKGNRCPVCANSSVSKKEIELSEKIEEIYPGIIERNKRFYYDDNNRRLFYEADILLVEKKIIIEFNGLYWHSEEKGCDRNYHFNKTKYFRDNGYKCFHVFEDEWDEDKEKVIKQIKEFIEGNILNEEIIQSLDNDCLFGRDDYEFIHYLPAVPFYSKNGKRLSHQTSGCLTIYNSGYAVYKKKI